MYTHTNTVPSLSGTSGSNRFPYRYEEKKDGQVPQDDTYQCNLYMYMHTRIYMYNKYTFMFIRTYNIPTSDTLYIQYIRIISHIFFFNLSLLRSLEGL